MPRVHTIGIGKSTSWNQYILQQENVSYINNGGCKEVLHEDIGKIKSFEESSTGLYDVHLSKRLTESEGL